MIENASAEAIQFTGLSHKIHRAASASAPCIFLIHGRAGNQEVMWTFKRVVPENWTIIAPQAPLSDPLGGYSWWLVKEHWSKDEAIAASSLLLDFISKALSFYSLSPNKIYASGFSQGGAVLSLCLQAQPQLFSRVALLASFIIEHEFNSSSKQLPELFIGHGLKDDIVPFEKAEKGIEYAQKRGFNVTVSTDEVGHKIGSSTMRELTNWFKDLDK